MDLKVERIDTANAKAVAVYFQEELQKKQEEIANKFAKSAKIAGFRAGKVPVKLVKQRFTKEIKQDTHQEIIQNIFQDALKQLDEKQENIIGEPSFDKFDENEKGLNIEISFSFKPDVDTSGFEKFIPEYITPEVTKEEIDSEIEKRIKMYAPIKEVTQDRGLKEDDFAKFDFEGFVDNEAFEGGSAKDYSLQIGSNQFIPGFEDGMKGMKKGEEKEIKVTFPAQYQAKNLASKDAIFKVKLHEISERKIPETLDEDMLKKLLPGGEENVTKERLEELIQEQIKQNKKSKLYLEELKPKFVEQIVKNLSFDLPNSIVEQEIDMQFRQAWSSLKPEEIEELKKDGEKLKAKRETFRKDATESVKLTFIVDKLARVHDIKVEDQEVAQVIYYEALRHNQDPKAYLQDYEKQGLLPAVKMALIEDKLFLKLFDKDETKEKES